MDKESIFQEELNQINSNIIRTAVKTFLINEVPEYFWKIPASTSGKYHPLYTLGEGGLVKHTKAAVKIAISLFEIEDLHPTERDIIISAIILHDTFKCGSQIDYNENGYTKFNHPNISSEKFKQFCMSFFEEKILENGQGFKWWIDSICGCIESHMGKWNINNYKETEILSIPENRLQKFVHVCDYLASRRFIEVREI